MDNATPTPWYRVPTVWLVFGIPFTAVVVGFIMLGFAIWSYDGLVVDDYYRRGKEINRDLARDHLATVQHRSASLKIAKRELHIKLSPSNTPPPSHIDVQLLHATRQGNDRRLLLERDANGHYRAALTELNAGRYNVQLAADGWRLLGSVTIPGDNNVELIAQAP